MPGLFLFNLIHNIGIKPIAGVITDIGWIGIRAKEEDTAGSGT
jgi:hypothetical protein